MKHDNIHSSIKLAPTPQIIPIPVSFIDGVLGIGVRRVLLGEAEMNDGIICDIVCVADNETERLGDSDSDIETLLDDVCDIEEDSVTLFVNDGDSDIPLVIIQILF